MHALTFLLERTRFAVRSATVIEVVRAVALTPLPGAPAVIEGVVDVRGLLVPVFDARARFGYAPRDIELSDHFIIARAGSRVAALHVDEVDALIEIPDASIEDPSDTVPGVTQIEGVAKLPDGLVLIHDLDRYLSAAESESLDLAMVGTAARSAIRNAR